MGALLYRSPDGPRLHSRTQLRQAEGEGAVRERRSEALRLTDDAVRVVAASAYL
jgi:hypothetical protein